ncbi:ParB/RepB/Spo0J family partition protein [Fluviibacterium sp. DFM31]|uniref:ParB/RepB/Spo0J family partition protein n=1 Tax=Meridianimarinicoccus marinus TaxID=3231483 RepID=A0ABV3L9R7_9RHOB
MSKKHDALFDDILSGLDAQPTDAAPTPESAAPKDRGGARFLKRSTTIGDRLSGEIEEKTLKWVDPAECRMWAHHNRAYDLLTEDSCRDLIDGIRAQGRQEFPAIVRRVSDGGAQAYEVICGARRHFAVSWLRANNYPQFKYLVDVRDLSDEEAFRLADIENRDREDISDFERARDYAAALERYYGGKQKAMAARLEVSEGWLSRYLQLAKLPPEIVAAYGAITDIKELHARQLKPLLARPSDRARVLAAAADLAAAKGQGRVSDGAQVLAALKAAVKPAKPKGQGGTLYRRGPGESGITVRKKGRSVVMEFSDSLSRNALEEAFARYMADRFGK